MGRGQAHHGIDTLRAVASAACGSIFTVASKGSSGARASGANAFAFVVCCRAVGAVGMGAWEAKSTTLVWCVDTSYRFASPTRKDVGLMTAETMPTPTAPIADDAAAVAADGAAGPVKLFVYDMREYDELGYFKDICRERNVHAGLDAAVLHARHGRDGARLRRGEHHAGHHRPPAHQGVGRHGREGAGHA